MKRLLYLLLMLILLLSPGCSCGSDTKWTGERYYSLCLNSNEKQEKSNTEYIYGTQNGIYQYSINDDKCEKLVNNADVLNCCIEQDYLYYSEEKQNENYDNKLLRRNLITGEEIVVYEGTGAGFDFSVTEKYLIYGIFNKSTFISAKENIKEKIDITTLFIEDEGKPKKEEIIEYEDMQICRYYDFEKEKYYIKYIRDCATGETVLYDFERKSENSIIYKNQRVIFDKKEFQYCIENQEDWKPINCLKTFKGTIFNEYLTTEDENIIGLLQNVRTVHINDPYRYQRDLNSEVLFRLNPISGENSIIFQTKNENTRIVGYEAGEIYLFEDFKVYRQRLDSKEREELFTLPENDEYIFDWQGDYLIVRYGGAKQNYAVAEAYKVK